MGKVESILEGLREMRSNVSINEMNLSADTRKVLDALGKMSK